MNTKAFFNMLGRLFTLVFLSASVFLTSCTNQSDPQPTPGGGTTNPGSTTPGSGTTTTPGGTTTSPGNGTVVATVDYIKQKSNLTFLAAAIAQAGMTAELNKGALTVWAPNDDAFRAAGISSTAAISAMSAADIQRILRYHTVGSLMDLSSLPTKVNTSYETTLSGAWISVYKVDKSNVSINGAKVTEGDIPTTGSTIHIINKVLTPPTAAATDVVKANTNLSLFYAAVNRAGTTIQNQLAQNSSEGITVFAPSNAAFIAAGYADEAAIQKASAADLATLLTYHTVTKRRFAQTFQNGEELTTVQGTTVKVTVGSDGKVSILGKGNGTSAANVTQADVVSNNAVIHVIDRVLLPK